MVVRHHGAKPGEARPSAGRFLGKMIPGTEMKQKRRGRALPKKTGKAEEGLKRFAAFFGTGGIGRLPSGNCVATQIAVKPDLGSSIRFGRARFARVFGKRLRQAAS